MNEFNVHKVTLQELSGFYLHSHFSPDSVIPISPQRIASYCANPRAQPDDVVLFYIKNDDCIIAFRTIWADEVIADDRLVRFGWCSGNWVDKRWRRRGLSMMLLKAALEEWDGRLMFTNYAPESLQGYLKSGLFQYKIERSGKRFYYKIDLYELVKSQSSSKIISITSSLLGFCIKAKWHLSRVFYCKHQLKDIQITAHENIDNSFFDLPEGMPTNTLFARNKDIYSWIFKYRWIEAPKGDIDNYPFSQYESNFSYRFVEFQNNNKIKAKIILSNRSGNLKMVYVWCLNQQSARLVMKYVANYVVEYDIKTLTLLDSNWAKAMQDTRNPFWWSKLFSMNIYSTFKLPDVEKLLIFDGDGDYIFT